jgi:hypothetical protein
MKHRIVFLVTGFLVLSLNSYCIYRYVKSVAVPAFSGRIIRAEHLQTGDIILRRGKGMVSHWFAQMSQSDPYYSHAGIVFLQNGKWKVVSSTQDCLKPGVIAQEFNDFLQGDITEDFAVYRYSLSRKDREVLEVSLIDDIINPSPFDCAFELSSDSAYYCTEYIYQRMKLFTACKNIHVSVSGSWKYIAPDDLYLNTDGQFIINGRKTN